MASPLTIIGIEVPRVIAAHSDRRRAGGEWQVGEHNLLERAVQAALKHTSPDQIRFLTGAPDEGVFRLVDKYGVAEMEFPAWLQATGDAARSADEGDLLVYLRASVVLADYAPLGKAVEAVRHLSEVERCELATRPQAFNTNLANVHVVERSESGVRLRPWSSLVDAEMSDFGVLCPAFEVMKLRSFTLNRIGGMAQTGTAFVWVDEGDQVSLEGPIDWLRAEVLLARESPD